MAELHSLIHYLQSTYPDFLPTEGPKYGEQFVLEVAVQLPEPTQVHIVEHNSANIAYTVSVSHLPPLLLKLLLPPTYPLEQPPIIHSLESRHDWLSADTLKILGDRLCTLWDKENVLGIWLDHIRNGELLSFLYSSPTSIK
jgi:E3 ubiquitin-protein ligase RNF14